MYSQNDTDFTLVLGSGKECGSLETPLYFGTVILRMALAFENIILIVDFATYVL